MIKLKRVYDPAEESDGFRILVDRLWPRGVSKEKAKVDLWLKDIAPSNELRTWFHKENNWAEFEKRYTEELKQNSELEELQTILKKEKKVTFLFASKNIDQNNAIVLRDFLQ